MNKIKFLTLSLALFLLNSCDLETTPTTSVDANSIYSSSDNAEFVLNGTWKNLFETFYTYRNPGWSAILRADDSMGSDVAINTKYGYRDHYTMSVFYGKTNNTGNLSWELGYQTINNVNSIIDNIDATSGSSNDKNRIKGQAYALRGFIYLHLASHYSFAINKDPDAVCAPIYTKTTDAETAAEGVAASNVSEVYAQAINDLEKALSLIPASYERSSKWKINREVVLGLLARTNLYARQWENAKKYSEELLALNNHLMTADEWNSGFNSVDNPEWIWGHPQTVDQNNTAYSFHFLDTTTKGTYYFSFNVDPYFAEKFEKGDVRNNFLWEVDPNTDKTQLVDGGEIWLRSTKFRFRDVAQQLGDIVLLRVAEIYLINAEAKAHLGESKAAVDELNQLRSARNASLADEGLDGQSLLDTIWLERRKELWGEGFSLVDVIRNQTSISRKEWPTTPYEYNTTDSKGNAKKVKLIPKGHRIFKFPDGSDFSANSKYYLYRIPDK